MTGGKPKNVHEQHTYKQIIINTACVYSEYTGNKVHGHELNVHINSSETSIKGHL